MKDGPGRIQLEGTIPASRMDLDHRGRLFREEDSSAPVDGGHGDNRFYGLDLRSPEATCSYIEGGPKDPDLSIVLVGFRYGEMLALGIDPGGVVALVSCLQSNTENKEQ